MIGKVESRIESEHMDKNIEVIKMKQEDLASQFLRRKDWAHEEDEYSLMFEEDFQSQIHLSNYRFEKEYVKKKREIEHTVEVRCRDFFEEVGTNKYLGECARVAFKSLVKDIKDCRKNWKDKQRKNVKVVMIKPQILEETEFYTFNLSHARQAFIEEKFKTFRRFSRESRLRFESLYITWLKAEYKAQLIQIEMKKLITYLKNKLAECINKLVLTRLLHEVFLPFVSSVLCRDCLKHSQRSCLDLMKRTKQFVSIQDFNWSFQKLRKVILLRTEERHTLVTSKRASMEKKKHAVLYLETLERKSREIMLTMKEEGEKVLLLEEDILSQKMRKFERERLLNERRQMVLEEALMKKLIIQEKKEAEDAMKFNVKVTKSTRRKVDIRAKLAQKQRESREQKQMLIEDKLSHELREDYIRMMQVLLLKQQNAEEKGQVDVDPGTEFLLHSKEAEIRKKKIEAEQLLVRARHMVKMNETAVWLFSCKLKMWGVRNDLNYSLLQLNLKQEEKNKLEGEQLRPLLLDKSQIETLIKKGRPVLRALYVRQTKLKSYLRKVLEDLSFVVLDLKKIKIINNTSRSLVYNNLPQQFKAKDLFHTLLWLSIRVLVSSIIASAETIAYTKRSQTLAKFIKMTTALIAVKKQNENKLIRKLRRDIFLMYKRSHLRTLMFKNYLLKVIKKYFLKLHHYAKYTCIIRKRVQTKIKALYGDIFVNQQIADIVAKEAKKDLPKNLSDHLTPLKRIQNQVLVCKHCKIKYKESKNTRLSCKYHSHKYSKSCPTHCERFGSKILDKSCRVHFRLRWTCCNEVEKANLGCKFKKHSPDLDASKFFHKLCDSHENLVKFDKDRRKMAEINEATDQKLEKENRSRQFHEYNRVIELLKNHRRQARNLKSYEYE
eukprot:augustus_masked-scaffold_16-processed-gene-0.52-mRNA-1 protein AED:1.00 eAED:1.00 QI:0/-1/0/0/-1/1/1/0/889